MAEREDAVVRPVFYREPLAWHSRAWSALTAEPGRLPHGLLLHGPDGLGKRSFAWRLAQSLLCLAPGADAAACAGCASCQRFEAGTHPDLLHVRPLADSITIGVDQVRELRDFVALTPHTAARKLVILEPAEAMNLNAANALLKVLEEPPASSVLLLITARLARLPATIRSRCALVAFRAPPPEQAAAWLRERGVEAPERLLEMAGGAPLRALALDGSAETANRERALQDLAGLQAGRGDPLACAKRWKDYGVEQTIEWFQRYVADAIRRELEGEARARNRNLLKDLFEYSDVLCEARGLVPGPLDAGLLLEDLLIRWARLHAPHGLN